MVPYSRVFGFKGELGPKEVPMSSLLDSFPGQYREVKFRILVALVGHTNQQFSAARDIATEIKRMFGVAYNAEVLFDHCADLAKRGWLTSQENNRRTAFQLSQRSKELLLYIHKQAEKNDPTFIELIRNYLQFADSALQAASA